MRLIRHNHDLSFMHNLSGNMGYLIPIACLDVLPGDSFIHSTNLMARLAPLAKPVMHPVEIRVHNWYVPNRIIWEDWEDFITEANTGLTYPTQTITSAAAGVLYDHMGCEPTVGSVQSLMPIRAYNAIWNEFYRDQDLAQPRNTNALGLAKIAWGKDYFTTARTTRQSGPSIEVGFSSGSVPISGIGPNAVNLPAASQKSLFETQRSANRNVTGWETNTAHGIFEQDPDNPGFPNIRADLTRANGGIDITALRNGVALQRMSEARSMFGSRYADYLRYYGVNPRDGRLDRPEYLGGGKQQISFSEVLSNSVVSGNDDPGQLFGHGIAGLRSRRYKKTFEEHGWMISLLSVRPVGIYQTGHPRKFQRRKAQDFWHRELELLPWQSIPVTEIYGGGDKSITFGFTPRYDEYRETQNYVSGTFRGGTEEDWTLARTFSTPPSLNESFITCDPSDRIYQDTTMPELLITANHTIKAKRLVAKNARLNNAFL
ncbi:MAG: capsid protein [Cressdnaviricota sp.]|nr:MAG: capsid protein [Cressdnaviricota sp.]